MSVNLQNEHLLEFLSLKGDCTGLYESTIVKISLLKNGITWLILRCKYSMLFTDRSGMHPLCTSGLINKLGMVRCLSIRVSGSLSIRVGGSQLAWLFLKINFPL